MSYKKIFLTLLLALLGAVPAFAIEPVSKCDALAAWAAALERLPADYQSFTALEPDQRSAVYGRLSHSQRAALWQEQMRRELAQDGWTEAQRTLIAETRALVTADNLAAMELGIGPASEAARVAFASLDARVEQAFSREAAARVFATLGPGASSRTESGLWGRCNCSESFMGLCRPDDYCILGGVCDTAFCGNLWLEFCDGLCCPSPGNC